MGTEKVPKGAFRLDQLSDRCGLLILSRKLADAIGRLCGVPPCLFDVYKLLRPRSKTTTVLCYGAPETRSDKRCVMISPCHFADCWSLHLLDFDWLKLY